MFLHNKMNKQDLVKPLKGGNSAFGDVHGALWDSLETLDWEALYELHLCCMSVNDQSNQKSHLMVHNCTGCTDHT